VAKNVWLVKNDSVKLLSLLPNNTVVSKTRHSEWHLNSVTVKQRKMVDKTQVGIIINENQAMLADFASILLRKPISLLSYGSRVA
jgi:hypothetical protein